MTPNIATAVTAAVCLLSTLTNAYAGTAHWRRDRPWWSASPEHPSGDHGPHKSHPVATRPWWSALPNSRPSPPASYLLSHPTESSRPIIVHTIYNGHPINATVVRVHPTPTINGNPSIRHEHGKPQVTESPDSKHHKEMSLIPNYGNHTLFHTNKWRIDNTSTPFKQIHSPANKTGVDLCLRACIEESECAFAGYSQRKAPQNIGTMTDGEVITIHHLNKTCSLYHSYDVWVGKLEPTHVDEKRILGPDLLALVEDRVPQEKLRGLLKDREWSRKGREDGVSTKGSFYGHDERALEDVSTIVILVTATSTSTTQRIVLTTVSSSLHGRAVKRAQSTTTTTSTFTVTSSTGTSSTPTQSVQFDMRKRFFLSTRVTYGSSDFNNLYIQNPTTRSQVSTPHLTSNRSTAALFNYSFSTSSINLCCTSSNSSLGINMIRDRDGDAYGSVILAPQVGTARMAMTMRNCAVDDGVGIVQISPRSSGDEDKDDGEDKEKEKERERKEAYEKLSYRYGRLHPPPPSDRRSLHSLHSLHSGNFATSTFGQDGIEALEPICGTRGASASLVWKYDRFGSWVVCKRFDGGSVDLRWWDVINDRGVDEDMCAKVDLEGVGVADGEMGGQESC